MLEVNRTGTLYATLTNFSDNFAQGRQRQSLRSHAGKTLGFQILGARPNVIECLLYREKSMSSSCQLSYSCRLHIHAQMLTIVVRQESVAERKLFRPNHRKGRSISGTNGLLTWVPSESCQTCEIHVRTRVAILPKQD